MSERLPVQIPHGSSFGRAIKNSIPRELGEAAWEGYDEDGHGNQSCKRLHQRGGFDLAELGYYLARAVESGRVEIRIVREGADPGVR